MPAAVVARRENYWLLSLSPPRHGAPSSTRQLNERRSRLVGNHPVSLSGSFFHFVSILLSASFPPLALSLGTRLFVLVVNYVDRKHERLAESRI